MKRHALIVIALCAMTAPANAQAQCGKRIAGLFSRMGQALTAPRGGCYSSREVGIYSYDLQTSVPLAVPQATYQLVPQATPQATYAVPQATPQRYAVPSKSTPLAAPPVPLKSSGPAAVSPSPLPPSEAAPPAPGLQSIPVTGPLPPDADGIPPLRMPSESAPPPPLPEAAPEPEPQPVVTVPASDPYGFGPILNSYRAQYGLAPVSYSANLTNWAAVNNSYGYGHTIIRSKRQNAAWGQGSPDEVGRQWMNSPGHRSAMLDRSVTTYGIHVTGNRIWTLNLD